MENLKDVFVLHKSSKIICEDRIITYDDSRKFIDKITNQVNNYNKCIGICLDRSEFLILSIFSLIENNITYVPIDTDYPEDRIKYILKDCNIDRVITQTKYEHKFKDVDIINIDCINNLKEENKIYKNEKINNELMYILYTSGSTGTPKGVEITRANIEAFIEGISQEILFNEKDRILCHTVPTFDIFFLECILPLIKGMTVVLANNEEHKNPKKIIDLLIKKEINMLQITPSKMILINNYDNDLKGLKSIEKLLIGGEKLSQKLLDILNDKTSANIYNVYGPTETTIWCTVSDLTGKKEVNIGKAIKNANIYILDENLNLQSEGLVGEIFITGKLVGKGYLNNKELTNSKFIKLPNLNLQGYLTGDFGKIREDGNLDYLYRKDNQVKVNGHRIELGEVENIVNKVNGIKQSFVFNNNSSSEENELILVYSGEVELDKEIKTVLNNKLPEYMIPSKIIRMEEIIIDKNGKIDKKKTIRHIEELIRNKNKVVRKDKNKIVEIIELNGATDSIMNNLDISLKEVGINSLNFIKIVVELEKEFEFEFDDEKLAYKSFNTINDLIDYVESKYNIN